MAQQFPHTKLHPPSGGDYLARPLLLARLRQASATRRLTLLSAPAGAGKTTAVAALRDGHPQLPLAWLTLDGDDNDVAAFLALLLAAVRQLHPGFGAATTALLEQTGNIDDGRRAASALINDLLDAAPPPFALVLDDLHAITLPAVYGLLDYLLEHLPPALHLVATTRYDPPLALARLRARGQLAEFRMADLRFTSAEVTSLCNSVLGLGLADGDIAQIQQRTEGWIAGVRLLTLTLGALDAPERARRISSFAQSQRFIFDYLADEVVAQLAPDDRAFLLETSLLSELTPAVCRAVTGRADAARLLERLYRRNLFLVELEAANASATYRYHGLFAQFLQRQLLHERPEQIPALHRRAAEALALPSRKVHHYLAAELWDEAVAVIEELGRAQFQQGFVNLPATWIEALPEAARERPWMRLLVATIEVQRGQMAAAVARLDGLEAMFRAQGSQLGVCATLMALIQAGLGFGDLALTERAVDTLLAMELPPALRASALFGRIWAAYFRSDWDRIASDVKEVLSVALTADDQSLDRMVSRSLGFQLIFCGLPMATFERYAETVLQRFAGEESLVTAGSYNILGGLRLLRGQFDTALEYIDRLQAITRRLGHLGWVDLYAYVFRISVASARGDPAAIMRLVAECRAEFGRHDTFRRSEALIFYWTARAAWLQGRLDEVRRAHRQLEELPAAYKPPYFTLVDPAIGAMTAWTEGRIDDAEALLRQAAGTQEHGRLWLMTAPVRLDLATLLVAARRPDAALAELRPLLAQIAEWEMPGLLLATGPGAAPALRLALQHGVEPELIRPILAQWEGARPAPANPDALTARELEVLRLIAQGASNRAIAERLVITERTVKAHSSSIFGKLGVSSRTGAVAEARRRGLI